MCFRFIFKISIILIFCAALFCGCEDLDTILPSAGNYKLNVQVNNTLLDDCSFVTSRDKIHLYFEESISNDKDVTALMVFLRTPSGEVVGRRVIYGLDRESSQDDSSDSEDLFVHVKSLDDNLPLFPMPNSLPAGRYIMVSQVMSGRNVLQRTEKPLYYIGAAAFSYDGINVYLPGVARSSQLIPRGTVVMLEADIDFVTQFDPYIIWYEGRNKISEGKYSDGAGFLFWKTPEQSGFYTIRAEVFPVRNDDRLSGFMKETSLLVSTMAIDVNLVSQNIPQLVHWYTLEGDLFDSKMPASLERSLNTVTGKSPVWMGANRTYGVATGCDDVISLPRILIPNNSMRTWQALFRFMPLSDGGILSVQFGSSRNVSMNLYIEGNNLILALTSPFRTVSQVVNIPENILNHDNKPSFITAGVYFTIRPGLLSAQINIIDDAVNNEFSMNAVNLNVSIDDEFYILMGIPRDTDTNAETEVIFAPNILWDEFALYHMPPMDIITAELRALSNTEPQLTSAN